MRKPLRLILRVVFLLEVARTGDSKVSIRRNGYSGVVIAINPEVKENPALLEAIKNTWRNASADLFRATRKRAYFRDITIVVPASWTKGKYSISNGETYAKADVLVSQQNAAYADIPYTLQFGECGESGSYIHLTPEYLLNDAFIDDHGARGKTIVHEWAHYRWGVYDEIATDGYDPFYLASDGRARPTSCTSMVKGEEFAVDWQSGTYTECQTDPKSSLPEDGCIFAPYEENQPSASIMAHQYLSSVTTFCDDTDSTNRHNSHAPNEQNRLCNLRSTWGVIVESEDFKNKRNSPNHNIKNTNPRFKVVRQPDQQRIVLVLDVSGSMDNQRLLMMKQAASTYLLQAVPHGSVVGLVQFSSNATALSGMSKIDDYSDRVKMKNLLPNGVGGGTSIGSGILEALWILEQSATPKDSASRTPQCDVRKPSGKQCHKGGTIIVLSDGQENQYPALTDIYDTVIDASTVVHSIVFTEDADPMLQVISEKTGGTWYFSDENKAHATTALSNAFVAAGKTNDGDGRREIFQIHSSSFTLASDSTQSGTIIVDRTIGRNTMVTFTWSQYNTPPNIVLQSPKGCTYSLHPIISTACNPEYSPDIDYALKMITFLINDDAEVGRWFYNIARATPYVQKVVVTATTMASSDKSGKITVDSGMGKVTAGEGEAIVIYAQVKMGFAPVLAARVTATVEKPNGEIVVVNLKDEGAAPDIRKEDGVYSRYFLDYSGPGRYSVQITVTGIQNMTRTKNKNANSEAATRIGLFRGKGFKLNTNAGAISSAKPIETGEFQRFTSAGAFSYTGSKLQKDVLRPARIHDLTASRMDDGGETRIRIMFSAPGDDYDEGKATAYEIRYALDDPAALRDRFDDCLILPQRNVIDGDVASPQDAGNTEEFVITTKSITANESHGSMLSLAVRALDDAGNFGKASNVATMSLSLLSNREGQISRSSLEYILMLVFMCTTCVLAITLIYLCWMVVSLKRKHRKPKR